MLSSVLLLTRESSPCSPIENRTLNPWRHRPPSTVDAAYQAHSLCVHPHIKPKSVWPEFFQLTVY